MSKGLTTSTDLSGLLRRRQTAATVATAQVPSPTPQQVFELGVNIDSQYLRNTRIISEALVANRAKEPSDEITGNRRDAGQETTEVSANGPIRARFSATSHDDLIQDALSDDNPAGLFGRQVEGVTFQGSDQAGDLRIRDTSKSIGPAGFIVGMLVQVEGFAQAEKTGTFRVTAVDTGEVGYDDLDLTPVYVTNAGGYTTEAAGRFVVITQVGAQVAGIAVSADPDSDGSTHVADFAEVAPSGAFSAFSVGDVIRIYDPADSESGLDEVQTAGPTGASQRFFRIIAKGSNSSFRAQGIAAKGGVLPVLSDNAPGLQLAFDAGLQMKDGSSGSVYTFLREVGQPGSSPTLYDRFEGTGPDSWQFQLASGERISQEFGTLGRKGESVDLSGSNGFGGGAGPGSTPKTTTKIVNSANNVLFARVADNQSAASFEARCFKQVQFTASNNGEASTCVGTDGANAIVSTSFTVEGSLQVVVAGSSVAEGNFFQDRFKQDVNTSLLLLIQSQEGHLYLLDMPEITINTADRQISGRGEEFVYTVNFRSVEQLQTFGRVLGFPRFLR